MYYLTVLSVLILRRLLTLNVGGGSPCATALMLIGKPTMICFCSYLGVVLGGSVTCTMTSSQTVLPAALLLASCAHAWGDEHARNHNQKQRYQPASGGQVVVGRRLLEYSSTVLYPKLLT